MTAYFSRYNEIGHEGIVNFLHSAPHVQASGIIWQQPDREFRKICEKSGDSCGWLTSDKKAASEPELHSFRTLRPKAHLLETAMRRKRGFWIP